MIFPFLTTPTRRSGFTLIELLVVISIISLLASVVHASLGRARDKGNAAAAIGDARAIRTALELYVNDMGFYPPDVNRGWDPGLEQSLPWNPDTGDTGTPSCSHCPSNWVLIVQNQWAGPYLTKWPQSTPWGGKYDYNYWDAGATRYGCSIPPGIYIGIQRDYANQNPVNVRAEQFMVNQLIDADGCINGETQIRLFGL
jgi:prepilin-type N-terminal cleavage/methylation domain-containing protein